MSLSLSMNTLKKEIDVSLRELPPEGLIELANFLDYVRFKFKKSSSASSPYHPIALGGLWKDESIDEKGIDNLRKEMWSGFGDRDL